MATLLSFHLLGLYPVPSTTQLLVLSPFIPRYTIHNSFLNISTTVTVNNFSSRSIRRKIPSGVPAYVESVTINGKPSTSRCYFDFYDAFRLGGDIVITLTADKAAADSCEGGVPESLSTGGFATARWLDDDHEFFPIEIFVFVMKLTYRHRIWRWLYVVEVLIKMTLYEGKRSSNWGIYKK